MKEKQTKKPLAHEQGGFNPGCADEAESQNASWAATH